jgi:hypothetical protein
MPQICSVTVVSQTLASYNKVYIEQRTGSSAVNMSAGSQGDASGCTSLTWRHPLGITSRNRVCTVIYMYINVPKERICTHTVRRYSDRVYGLATGLHVNGHSKDTNC